MFPNKLVRLSLLLCYLVMPGLCSSFAQSTAVREPQPDNVKRIPEPGINVPAADAAALEAKLAEFRPVLERMSKELKSKPPLAELVPDVEIFYKAVHDALAYNEFYTPREITAAKTLLEEGRKRADYTSRRQALLDDCDGFGRSRLPFQDRRLGATVWPRSSGYVPGGIAFQAPARSLVSRPGRKADRAEFHQRPHAPDRRLCAGGYLRPSSLRTLLQRE